MADTEGRRRNNTLDDAIVAAAQKEGMGWLGCFRLKLALRRLSNAEHAQLEAECTKHIVAAGVPLPANVTVAGDVLVGDWGDGTILQILIDALPKILDFISKLLPLFFMFATLLVCCGLLAGTASAQCSGGSCSVPVRKTVERARAVTVDRQPVRSVTKRVTVQRERRLLNWLRRR